jgi:tripartite-type tricarboxylate transporter receptor subunit TctC
MWRRSLAAAALALPLFGLRPTSVRGQAYPSGPIRLIVPFPAGGSTDLVGRAVAEPLAALLRQPVVVDNRAGAGGLLGSEQASRAAPDGHTLLMGGVQTVLLAALGQARGWDPMADLVSVAIVADIPNVLVTTPTSPLDNVAEVIRRAKAAPGRLSYASAGVGSASHLVGELFTRETGTNILHVPYRGNQPALTDLLGGQVDMMFANLAGLGGSRLRILALTGTRRSQLAPEVPTFGEQSVGGLENGVWMGLHAPRGTPAAVVARLGAAIGEVMRQTETQARLRSIGADPAYAPPDVFAARMTTEFAMWRRVVQEANIRLE